MTEQITVPRATWDSMREALEEIICAHPATSTMRQVHAIVAGRNALTAAKAVQPQAQAEAILGGCAMKRYTYTLNPWLIGPYSVQFCSLDWMH